VVEGADAFTFAGLHERTPDLTGPERLEVFYALPAPLQEQAWAHLRWRMDHVSDCEHRDWCGDRA
jgi:hypothetical protein